MQYDTAFMTTEIYDQLSVINFLVCVYISMIMMMNTDYGENGSGLTSSSY